MTEADNGTWESDSENLPSVSGAEAILKDRQGRVWIAGWEGVHYSEGNGWRRVTTASGLPDNHVNCIYEDRDGHIWFGTDGGVVHYDGHIFQTIRSPHIKSTNAIIQDRRNRFWFGTINGVIRYTIDPTPPDVRILHVVADRIYNLSGSIDIYVSNPQITFEYTGLGFRTEPRNMLYIYRLEGLDDDWQQPTRSRQTRYTQLTPEGYTIMVKSIDRDLNYTPHRRRSILRYAATPGMSELMSWKNSFDSRRRWKPSAS